ncbi:hypothetical protein MHYP_G00112560 [Metynnis hypsauchen]
MRELGKTVMDCFTRRDKQLEKRFQTLMPLVSTPFLSAHSMSCIREDTNRPNQVPLANLRNCNPRLASLLRRMVKTVDELERVRTLRDLTSAKSYWNKEQQDAAGKRLQISKASKKGSAQNQRTSTYSFSSWDASTAANRQSSGGHSHG